MLTIGYRALRVIIAPVTVLISASFYTKRKYYDEPIDRAFKRKK